MVSIEGTVQEIFKMKIIVPLETVYVSGSLSDNKIVNFNIIDIVPSTAILVEEDKYNFTF
jgi:hypothetical protein